MPSEIVTIQIGQCGNQIGVAFWELILAERAKLRANGDFDSLFRGAPTRRARCVVVDTEEGVIAQLMKGRLRRLFEGTQVVSGVSGAGNNWANGFAGYGPLYRSDILDKVRREVEACSSLQGFFLLHSLGGGTGSGLGTYVLAQLADEYPQIFRFAVSVFPSKEDDVVTSPYNALLATSQLAEHADCVLPISNDSLLSLCHPKRGKRVERERPKAAKGYFAQMNSIVAHLLSDLTCSTRYSGKLNVDFNEITANLVRFPRIHFLLSSMAPMQLLLNGIAPRNVDELFGEVLLPENQLIGCAPDRGTYLAAGLFLRGEAAFGDVARNADRLRERMRCVAWSAGGFKYGLCAAPPTYHSASLLCLANNTAVADLFDALRNRFAMLYRRKAHVHHYKTYICEETFEEANRSVGELREKYLEFERPPNSNTNSKYYKRVI